MSKIKEARKRIMGVIDEHNKVVKELLAQEEFDKAGNEAYIVKGLLEAWDIVFALEGEEYVPSSNEKNDK